jgi:tripartite-type tricarboxylate transporter receptor subunit TctC
LKEVFMKTIFCVLGVSIVLMVGMSHISFAAGDYPNRPITIIVPFSPGGMADLNARTFAMAAEKYLGQPLVVANKAGGGGVIGAVAGAQAAPDGYTLTMTHSAITGNMESEIAEGRKPPFTRHDFTTIGIFNLAAGCHVVPYDHPWKTMLDLIRDCKARPNYYRYASSGINGSTWIAINVLSMATGIKLRHIPFRGGGEALTAVVGGHVDFTTAALGTARPLAEGKKLRLLGVMGKQRVNIFPDVPTLQELGIRDADFIAWNGLLAPKRTPEDAVKKLRDVAEKVAKDKRFIEAVEKTGDGVNFLNGDEFAKYWDAESEQLAKVYQTLAKEKESSK